MKTYLVLAAAFLAASSTIAVAQSSTATSGTTAPMTTAPVAGSGRTTPGGQGKVVIPPAARSGEKGLRVGNDAVGDPVEIKRQKCRVSHSVEDHHEDTHYDFGRGVHRG